MSEHPSDRDDSHPFPYLRAVSTLALVLLTSMAFAQTDLDYQERDDRWEGLRAKPVSVADDIELVSVRVDYQEPVQGMPDALKLRFFLDRASDVHVRVREVEYRHYYLMDQVRPRQAWQAGYGYVFEWPTEAVLRSLPGLGVYDLGVVALVGSRDEHADVEVAPVILFHSNAPSAVNAYLFTARTHSPADITCEVYAEGSTAPRHRQRFRRVPAGRPFTCRWDASGQADGRYRVVMSGYALDSGDDLAQVVRFHHRSRLK